MAVNSLEQELSPSNRYKHAHYEGRRNFLRFLLKYLGFPLLAKVDRIDGMENFPLEGAALLMINHIAFIDPFIVLNAAPRNIVPMAKSEVYNYPVFGIFPRIWGVIPVYRTDYDRQAIQGALRVLRAGEIVLVAPEGTRGPHLGRGKEGVAYLASRAAVPIVPIAVKGTHGFPALRYTRPWQGKGAHVTFGHPFRFKAEYRRAGREQLREMTDEAMYILSAMLPHQQRGVYSNLSQATQDTITWDL